MIRTPYVFYNRTLLTLEVVIRRTPKSEDESNSAIADNEACQFQNEKERFTLEPEQKHPIDPLLYFAYSIKVRVVDQNSIAIEEKGHNQQMSIYKKAVNQPKSAGNALHSQPHASPDDSLNSNAQLFVGRNFSKDVSIHELTRLDSNQGPGVFVSGPNPDSLCLSIKR